MKLSRSSTVLGYLAASLGAAAGILQLTGAQPSWTGNKNDPITLGFVTVALALIMGFGALIAGRKASIGSSLASSAALGLPALLGLSTAGMAWLPAAILGLVAAWGELRLANRRGSVWATLDATWPSILLSILAVIYIALGVTEWGWVGAVGIVGGLLVLSSLAFRTRERWVSGALLFAGAVPFAIATAMTGITILTSVLMIALGLPGLLHGDPSTATTREVPAQ
jgi:hypothetical protein